MAFIREHLVKKHNFYLCFTSIATDGAFSCHLYNKKENTIYMGSDKIKSKNVQLSNAINFDYDTIIPIREIVYEDIMRMNFIEIIHLGVNGVLKKYNLEEYAV
jgi:hypothetical protein